MIPKRPILRYHGGKWMLAKWIISHFPPHKRYTEAFGGAASVLLQKQRSHGEVYNDLWGTVVNVFRVMRDKESSNELKRLLRLTPFSRSEFEDCRFEITSTIDCPIEKARRTILRSFAGFGSASTNENYATGFRSNSTRPGSTPARDWQNYPSQIDAFTERLMGVIIESRNAIDVLSQHDCQKTLHYIDPPYVHATRNVKKGNTAYAFEMNDDEHLQLLQQIVKLDGMVVLSGYRNELYDEILKDWKRVDRSAFADGASRRVESLWLNPLCWERQPAKKLF